MDSSFCQFFISISLKYNTSGITVESNTAVTPIMEKAITLKNKYFVHFIYRNPSV
jgi:hypothetical protein